MPAPQLPVYGFKGIDDTGPFVLLLNNLASPATHDVRGLPIGEQLEEGLRGLSSIIRRHHEPSAGPNF